MNTREVLAKHHGIRYRMDEGWSCVCGYVLPTSGTTPLTRQAKHDEAVQQWVSHLWPFLAADDDALLERVEAAEAETRQAIATGVAEVMRAQAKVARVEAVLNDAFGVEIPGARDSDASHNGAHDVVLADNLRTALDASETL